MTNAVLVSLGVTRDNKVQRNMWPKLSKIHWICHLSHVFAQHDIWISLGSECTCLPWRHCAGFLQHSRGSRFGVLVIAPLEMSEVCDNLPSFPPRPTTWEAHRDLSDGFSASLSLRSWLFHSRLTENCFCWRPSQLGLKKLQFWVYFFFRNRLVEEGLFKFKSYSGRVLQDTPSAHWLSTGEQDIRVELQNIQ